MSSSSSTAKNVFVRGSSPATAAFAAATTDLGQHRAIGAASCLNDLIELIPSRYQAILSPILRNMHKVHEKHQNAQKALAALKTNQTNGTWPSFIAGMHNPFSSVQITKESLPALADELKSANDWFKKQKESALTMVIALKEGEVEHLEKQCSPSVTRDLMLLKCSEDWASLKKSLGSHVENPTPSKGIAIPTFFSDEYANVKGLVPIWAAKAWDFTRIRSQKLSLALEKKKELAEQASDAMDVDQPVLDKTMQKTVEDLVLATMRQKNKPAGNKQRGRNQVISPSNLLLSATNSSLGKRKKACPSGTEEEPLRSPEAKRYKNLGHSRHHETETNCEYLELGPSSETGQEELENKIRSSKWSVAKPSSIPKEILDLPREQALSIIQSRVPLTMVSNADLKIKLGPGVLSIPENIDKILSLGHRFLFPSGFSLDFPRDSFISLARVVKWKFFFASNPGNSSDFLDKHPQFRIPKTASTAVPDSTPKWVEDMLERGKSELSRQLSIIPVSTVTAKIVPNYKREITALRTWRKATNFLVLQADKNLGTTVVSSDWYQEKLNLLVTSNKDFLHIGNDISACYPMLRQVFNEIENCTNAHLPHEIKEYILANCSIGKIVNLPKFHGLPKIHKTPWALRPIVPCHSYPLTNASKVLSFLLKPYVGASPWILESTQDLARTLENIRIPTSDRYWICTGDVTAMYPNIPRERAHQILGELMYDTTGDLAHKNLIIKLAQWSDNYLVFTHQNKIFRQTDGLAMGIPAAPDVANLYMAHFEDSFAGNFLLYKRYIDDVFVLVKAPTKKAAFEQLSVIKADGLELTWSVEEKTNNFLDLQVTLEQGYLSFKPYRKPLNSYERLPFTSAHPVHVKRAAFCGEVSRMARLCSNSNSYFTEIGYVRDIYLRRGYPSQLLHTWIKAEAKNRWNSRYEDTPNTLGGSPLWLKSKYNAVWKHIDLHKVWSAMETGIDKEGTPLESVNSIKLSLARYRNLGEISNKYNADVQRGLLVEENNEELEQLDVDKAHPTVQYPGLDSQLDLGNRYIRPTHWMHGR
jgi:hypothetical protein